MSFLLFMYNTTHSRSGEQGCSLYPRQEGRRERRGGGVTVSLFLSVMLIFSLFLDNMGPTVCYCAVYCSKKKRLCLEKPMIHFERVLCGC